MQNEYMDPWIKGASLSFVWILCSIMDPMWNRGPYMDLEH